MHLRLPGCGEDGPTLEIYQYATLEDEPLPVPNRVGLRHIAFLVDDVAAILDRMTAAGGRALGEISTAEVSGKGQVEFVYAADPDGNIIELQRWF
jgi:catechol 2,3-dioxygenase-like lactoylglutathione lyase family enzyme